MSNMSYCRFENTLADLRDCAENIHDVDDLSHDELRARKQLIALCRQIVEETTEIDEDGNEVDDDE